MSLISKMSSKVFQLLYGNESEEQEIIKTQLSEQKSQIEYLQKLLNDFRLIKDCIKCKYYVCNIIECNESVAVILLNEKFLTRELSVQLSDHRTDICECLSSVDFSVILLESGNIEQIGGAMLILSDESNYYTASLDNVHIFEAYQNKGYGKMLITAVLEYCKEHKITRVTGNQYHMDIDTPDKKARWEHFYFDIFGFIQKGNKIYKEL